MAENTTPREHEHTDEMTLDVVSAPKKSAKERGAAMVEYALLLALIAIVAVGAIRGFGGGVGAEYNDINADIDAAINGTPPAAG